MNDEIKEIIELINTKYKDYYIDDFLSGEDIKKLVDYITNLQKQLENYQKALDETMSEKIDLQQTYFNIRHRINKAIEYLYDFNLADSIILKRSYKDLLNILKGDSDENN